MKRHRRTLSDRVGSFRHAIFGLVDILRTEHTAWVHVTTTGIVLLVSWWVQLSLTELCIILLCIITVWSTEAINTVFEILVNIVSPNFSTTAKRAKDIAAAAVLIASVGSAMIGLLIFIPAIQQKISG